MTRCITILLLLLLVVAGCARRPATTAASGQAGASGAGAVELTEAERGFLFAAEEELVSRCMARYGFRYVAVTPPADDQVREFPYGNDDVAWARRHGFGILDRQPSRLDEFLRNHPNTRIVQRLSPAQQQAYGKALTGDMGRQIVVTLPDGHKVSATTDGCVASVRRQLYGDLRDWLRNEFAIQGIAREAHDRVLSDRRYLDALDDWRACMRARGYQFADPGAARDAVGARQQAQGRSVGHDQLRIREIAVAVADAECARTSRLVSVATDLDGSYRVQVTAQQEGVVIAYREQQARGLRRARALLGAP